MESGLSIVTLCGEDSRQASKADDEHAKLLGPRKVTMMAKSLAIFIACVKYEIGHDMGVTPSTHATHTHTRLGHADKFLTPPRVCAFAVHFNPKLFFAPSSSKVRTRLCLAYVLTLRFYKHSGDDGKRLLLCRLRAANDDSAYSTVAQILADFLCWLGIPSCEITVGEVWIWPK